jgi:hypothetical protein
MQVTMQKAGLYVHAQQAQAAVLTRRRARFRHGGCTGRPSSRSTTSPRSALALSRSTKRARPASPSPAPPPNGGSIFASSLRACRVPRVEEERFRDLVRARADLRADLMRARHRLSKLLLGDEASSTPAPRQAVDAAVSALAGDSRVRRSRLRDDLPRPPERRRWPAPAPARSSARLPSSPHSSFAETIASAASAKRRRSSGPDVGTQAQFRKKKPPKTYV